MERILYNIQTGVLPGKRKEIYKGGFIFSWKEI